MVIYLLTFVLFFSSWTFAVTSSKCPGESGYYFVNYKHRNPTQGGFVSNKADVQDTDDLLFIGPDVTICGSSRVSDRARIFGDVTIKNAKVKDEAEISESAVIENGVVVSGNAKVSGSVHAFGSVEIGEGVTVTEEAILSNTDSEKLVQVGGKSRIAGSAHLTDNAVVGGGARVGGHSELSGDVRVDGKAIITGHTKRSTGVISEGTLDEPDFEAIAEEKRKKAAYEAKCREEEELKKIAANAAALQESLKKEALQKKLAAIREDVADLGKQANYKVKFSKENCFMEVERDGKKLEFNFRKDSTSSERESGSSGVRYERIAGGLFSVVIESELQNNEWTYFPLISVNDEDFAKTFKEKLQFYANYCRDL